MVVYFRKIQVFMTRAAQGTDHVWLVMMKAMRALTRYAAAGIEETGLGLSDFGVLELLLHKGPLPVNTIGPNRRFDPGLDQYRCGPSLCEGLGNPGRERRRPACSYRRAHPAWEGSHCFRLSKAFRADEEGVLRTKPRRTSLSRSGA